MSPDHHLLSSARPYINKDRLELEKKRTGSLPPPTSPSPSPFDPRTNLFLISPSTSLLWPPPLLPLLLEFQSLAHSLADLRYLIPQGTPYTGGWCRPQNDGPGLRAITAMALAAEKPEAGARVWELVKRNLAPSLEKRRD